MSPVIVREISPGVHWIQECGPDRSDFVDGPTEWYDPDDELHIPQNAYLFEGEETLLFDTLSPASGDHVLSELDAVLGEDGLDYLVVSHPDLPHAGNAMAILREYPDATLVAPGYGTGHELYHLKDAVHVTEGDSIDVGGHVLDFHEAHVLDAPVSVWMSARELGWLLPVDWFGFPHTDRECMRCVDELDHDVTVDRLVEFHGRALFWFQYVDVPTMCELHEFASRDEPAFVTRQPGHRRPTPSGRTCAAFRTASPASSRRRDQGPATTRVPPAGATPSAAVSGRYRPHSTPGAPPDAEVSCSLRSASPARPTGHDDPSGGLSRSPPVGEPRYSPSKPPSADVMPSRPSTRDSRAPPTPRLLDRRHHAPVSGRFGPSRREVTSV